MPLYEYLCDSCGTLFEEFYRLKDDSRIAMCPKCGDAAIKVIFTAPALHGECGSYANRRFPYYDESLDVRFESLNQKKQYLKSRNLRIKERGETEFKPRTREKDPNLHIIKYKDDKDFDKQVSELAVKKAAALKK